MITPAIFITCRCDSSVDFAIVNNRHDRHIPIRTDLPFHDIRFSPDRSALHLLNMSIIGPIGIDLSLNNVRLSPDGSNLHGHNISSMGHITNDLPLLSIRLSPDQSILHGHNISSIGPITNDLPLPCIRLSPRHLLLSINKSALTGVAWLCPSVRWGLTGVACLSGLTWCSDCILWGMLSDPMNDAPVKVCCVWLLNSKWIWLTFSSRAAIRS